MGIALFLDSVVPEARVVVAGELVPDDDALYEPLRADDGLVELSGPGELRRWDSSVGQHYSRVSVQDAPQRS